MTDPAVACTIDLDGARQADRAPAVPEDLEHRRLGVRASSRSRRSRTATGPTVLVSGGNHGDEYEGQIAALRLVHELDPSEVHGRMIVDPGDLEGRVAGRTRGCGRPARTSTARSRARPTGPPNEQLADYFTRVLFPMADVVIDIHSGGRTAWFMPCSHMHVVDDPAQRKAMLEGMLAWNSDFHFLYVDVNGTGLLPVEAENQGKIVITTELGGGGRVPAPVHGLAWSGLTNVLRHVGVLEGEVQTRASLGLPDAVILDGRDPRTT